MIIDLSRVLRVGGVRAAREELSAKNIGPIFSSLLAKLQIASSKNNPQIEFGLLNGDSSPPRPALAIVTIKILDAALEPDTILPGCTEDILLEAAKNIFVIISSANLQLKDLSAISNLATTDGGGRMAEVISQLIKG